ncbi:MAG: hypothetical protein Q8K75_08015 [Chlamydiales bacterium]|nr:hypothetical protein [Chlamydiales bacterium]
MEKKLASLDASWTKYYLNEIERNQRFGGISGHVASIQEAGMIPAAGLRDAAWHGWQALSEADGWHLVRSFALLATSIAALPLIIIAPNAIVTTSDKLRVREQWDKPTTGYFERIKFFVTSPQFLTGLATGIAITASAVAANALLHTPMALAEPAASSESNPVYSILGTAILGGVLALPLFSKIMQPVMVPVLEPQAIVEAEAIYDPEPTDPPLNKKHFILFNEDDTVVGANGKCHVAKISEQNVYIEDWRGEWPLQDDSTIVVTETRFSNEQPNGFEVEQTYKLCEAQCQPFVAGIWHRKTKERPVCDDGESQFGYVLIDGKKYEVDYHKSGLYDRERLAIIQNKSPIFLEYKYLPPQK